MIRINAKIGWRFHMLSAHRINPLYAWTRLSPVRGEAG
jgi:hypothetical protein